MWIKKKGFSYRIQKTKTKSSTMYYKFWNVLVIKYRKCLLKIEDNWQNNEEKEPKCYGKV